jgi:hypothetical protein
VVAVGPLWLSILQIMVIGRGKRPQAAAYQWFVFAILCCSQSGNDLNKDLTKFGFNLNMKVVSRKNPSVFLAYYHSTFTFNSFSCWIFILFLFFQSCNNKNNFLKFRHFQRHGHLDLQWTK